MKYMILLGDGMADEPIKELKGKTPLEYAHTPNMDICAGHMKGMLKTVPDSLPPGSDVANLSILGYDVEKYYTGRAPLEAAAKGIKLRERDVAYRCNFVTIKNGAMADFSANHINSNKAHLLIDMLNREMEIPNVRFYPGVSYRNIMIWENGETDSTTPPHDISDRPVKHYLPSGTSGAFLINIMNKASKILEGNSIYPQANSIWLWGEGKKPNLPAFSDLWGKDGCIVSAVDLMLGIGTLIGFHILKVPGVTGFIDTNYKGKIEAATSFLSSGGDFAYVHVEAPDEASHMGDVEKKIEAIELFDKEVVSRAIEFAHQYPDRIRIAVLPDHPTPISIKTHTRNPVPFAIFDSSLDIKPSTYSEISCSKGIFIAKGYKFIKEILFSEEQW